MRTLASLFLLVVAMAVSACAAGASPLLNPSADASASPSPTPTPRASALPSIPSPSPSATALPPPSATASEAASSAEPTAGGGSGEVIVTFQTAGDEEFRILLTDAEDIRTARRLLSGEESNLFPNGLIVRGGDGSVNSGYTWHIDPESVQFAQFATEVCDGRPSYVEEGTHTSDRFCPWTAAVVGIEPAG